MRTIAEGLGLSWVTKGFGVSLPKEIGQLS